MEKSPTNYSAMEKHQIVLYRESSYPYRNTFEATIDQISIWKLWE
jgi:hypothetical protein